MATPHGTSAELAVEALPVYLQPPERPWLPAASPTQFWQRCCCLRRRACRPATTSGLSARKEKKEEKKVEEREAQTDVRLLGPTRTHDLSKTKAFSAEGRYGGDRLSTTSGLSARKEGRSDALCGQNQKCVAARRCLWLGLAKWLALRRIQLHVTALSVEASVAGRGRRMVQ